MVRILMILSWPLRIFLPSQRDGFAATLSGFSGTKVDNVFGVGKRSYNRAMRRA